MKVKIVSDSSADLLTLEGVDFESVPLHVIVGEQAFVDNADVDLEAMQEALNAYKGKTSTSCPSPDDWKTSFGDADVVFCVTMTSGISGTNASANLAKQLYEGENPGKRVFVYDTLSTGAEQTLIVLKLRELVLSGLEPEEIDRQMIAYLTGTQLYFSLAGLQNFAKNGRVSPLVAKGVGILGIRIVGRASDEGTLEPLDKCRGNKKALPCIVEHMRGCGYRGGRVVISHNHNEADALELKRLIEEAFGSADIRIYKTRALCSYYAEPQSILVGLETE